ncbi:hypothetical protein ACSBR2_005861 [Camellia fascicularis]
MLPSATITSIGHLFFLCQLIPVLLRKMAQKNALVRKFPSVEILGCTTDNMTMDFDERYFHGKPQNSFHKAVNIPDVAVFPRNAEEVSKIVKSCNKYKVPMVEPHHSRVIHYHLMEVMVEKMGLPDGLDSGTSKGYGDVLRCCWMWSKIERQIATLEFDRDRKSMGVIVSSSSRRKSLLVKMDLVAFTRLLHKHIRDPLLEVMKCNLLIGVRNFLERCKIWSKNSRT